MLALPSSCFFQEVIFQILENLMATSFYIVPEKNVSCSWINYFCYHSSNYDYHKNVDVSRVIHNISITYRYLGLVSELRVIEKTIFFSFLMTKLYISLTLVISICNVARDGSSTREQTITE